MPFELAIKVIGKEQLINAFDRLGQDLGNLKGPLTGLAHDVIAPMIAARFAAHGPGWAPLNPQYAIWKAKAFPGKGILERTGAMRTAFSGGTGWEIQVTNTRLQIDPSTKVPYWRYHQYGTKRIPARPIVQFDAKQRTMMIDYLAEKAAGFARNAGFSVKVS